MRKPEGLSPHVSRNESVSYGAPRAIVFELSVIFSLVLVISAFKFFPTIQRSSIQALSPQELVRFEEIENTRQENRPPPPPRPPIPIEAPSDEALDDVDIASSELDVSQEVAPPAPELNDGLDDESFFIAVEEMPQIIGGMKSILERLEYPELAMRAGVQGRVFVLAYVNEKGDVVKAEVQRGIGAGCDEAAVRAVMNTKFIPGKQRGKPVKVRISIPIRFQIQG